MSLQRPGSFAALTFLTLILITQLAHAAERSKRGPLHQRSSERETTRHEIRQLRDLLQQQQQQLNKQQEALNALQTLVQERDQQLQEVQRSAVTAESAAKVAQQQAAAAESSSKNQKPELAILRTDVGSLRTSVENNLTQAKEQQKRVSGLEEYAGRFRLNGDVRVRAENFLQDRTQDRYRERIRLRLGLEGKLNEDNETLTNVFERKTIGFDRGYITFNPHQFKPLSITGGKFAFTWQRTSVTFDPDLNPEGFSEKLAFDLHNSVLKNISFTGLQLLFNEVSAGPDSFAAGGQIAAKLQLGNAWSLTPSYTILNWRHPDVILNEPAAINGTAATGPFAPNGITNATFKDVNGVNHFLSRFLYSDLILNNQFRTPISRLPLNLVAEYLNNLNAATNRSHAYGADLSVGQTKNKNDFQIGYAFLRDEQDAAIASFVESDQRAPTNVLQHKVYASWKVRKNTLIGYSQFIGRTLDSNAQNAKLAPGTLPGQREPYLKRGQFDVIYSF
jgi:putative porin